MMREHQSVIGQSVGHHIILAVDVVHRPMNPALSKGVTEGDAGSKVRPQVGRSASSLPAAASSASAAREKKRDSHQFALHWDFPAPAPVPCPLLH